MRPDFRRLFLTLAGTLCLAAPSRADDPGRYALGPSRDGIVRLDTATGAVSHCQPENGVWHCEPLVAEDDATRTRLDGIAAQVADLSASLAVLNARVAALALLDQSAAPPAMTQPATAEPGLVRQALGRFLDLVRTLKHGRVSPA